MFAVLHKIGYPFPDNGQSSNQLRCQNCSNQTLRTWTPKSLWHPRLLWPFRAHIYRILKLWRETGGVICPSRSLQGRLWDLNHNDVQYLVCLIQQNPNYFLDELLCLLRTNRFISVHYTTLHLELKRHGVSLKKLKQIAEECSKELRVDFIRRMAQYSPEEIGFIDETSKDERTTCRQYGRSRKGTRAAKRKAFIRGRRTTITEVLSMDGIVAGTMVEGSMTKATFMEFLEFIVVCTVKFYSTI